MLSDNQIAGFFKIWYRKKEVNDEVYFLHTDKHQSLLPGDISFWVSVTRHAQRTQNKFAYLCNISIKTWGMKLIFCLLINTKVFNKLIVSLWVCVARQTQSTKSNHFTISLQYLKENMKDEVDFLPADKRWRLFQIDTSFQVCVARHAQNTWNNKLAQWIFYMQKSMKACYKLMKRFFDG